MSAKSSATFQGLQQVRAKVASSLILFKILFEALMSLLNDAVSEKKDTAISMSNSLAGLIDVCCSVQSTINTEPDVLY